MSIDVRLKVVEDESGEIGLSQMLPQIFIESSASVSQPHIPHEKTESPLFFQCLAGLEVGETGDIKVNEYLQTNDPDIYAGGDCVRNIHLLTGKPVFAPMGSTANKHGRVIANNIMGYGEKFKGVLGTAVVKVFDYNVGKSGLTETQAREAGFEVVTTLVPSSDIPHYYPTKKPLLLKLIADRKTRKLLGIQGVGPGEVVKRIDVLAAAMSLGATIDDLPSFDLGYAPPYSTAIDIAAHAANVLRNKIDGIAPFLTPMEVKNMADRGEDFLWLDVRSPEEYMQTRIEDPRVKLVPLGMLRRRIQELPRGKKGCHPLQGRPARLRGPDDSCRIRLQRCTGYGWRDGRLAL